MAEMFYDDDADLSPSSRQLSRCSAITVPRARPRAQPPATPVDVRAGCEGSKVPRKGRGRGRAEVAGPPRSGAEADVISGAGLTPRSAASVRGRSDRAEPEDGDALFFAHGLQHPIFSTPAGRGRRRHGRAEGSRVRRSTSTGGGVPALVVGRTPTGHARRTGLSYAAPSAAPAPACIRRPFGETGDRPVRRAGRVLRRRPPRTGEGRFRDVVEAGYARGRPTLECLHEPGSSSD